MIAFAYTFRRTIIDELLLMDIHVVGVYKCLDNENHLNHQKILLNRFNKYLHKYFCIKDCKQ